MWEDVTIVLCGVGFSAAAALLVGEVMAVVRDWHGVRYRSHR